jgi:erythromycin esterase-like protein
MKSELKLYVFSCLLIFCGPGTYGQKNILTKSDIQVIKERFIPLNDNIIISDDTPRQFKPLYDLARTKTFVSIGEATHGTDEIRQFQMMLAKGLVSGADFKAVVLGETPLLDSYPFFDFIVNGNGDINKLENRIYSNIRPLLLWLSQYNSTRTFEQKILLLGSGVDEPMYTIDFVESHFRFYKSDIALASLGTLRELIREFKSTNQLKPDSLNRSTVSVIDILNKAKGKSDSLDFKIDCMVRSLHLMVRILPNQNQSLRAFQQRDSVIFENLKWVNRLKGKTAIILAHNLHINRKAIAEDVYTSDLRSFGEYLAKEFDQKYLSIGTEIEGGYFLNSQSEKDRIIEDKFKLGTMIGSVRSEKFGLFLLDEKLRKIFNNSKMKITKGTWESYLVDGRGILGDSFDGIIYVKKSTPYALYNKEDYCTLFVNLNNDLKNTLIKDGQMSVFTQFKVLKPLAGNELNYSVYFNDEDKKTIKHYTSSVQKSPHDLICEVSEGTKYISISIELKNLDYFNLKEIKLNGEKVHLRSLDLKDWNRTGYKFRQSKNDVFVTRLIRE